MNSDCAGEHRWTSSALQIQISGGIIVPSWISTDRVHQETEGANKRRRRRVAGREHIRGIKRNFNYENITQFRGLDACELSNTPTPNPSLPFIRILMKEAQLLWFNMHRPLDVHGYFSVLFKIMIIIMSYCYHYTYNNNCY